MDPARLDRRTAWIGRHARRPERGCGSSMSGEHQKAFARSGRRRGDHERRSHPSCSLPPDNGPGEKQTGSPVGDPVAKLVRRRPTLPRGRPRSTIGAEGLNFRVRNGAGCFPFAMVAETLWRCSPLTSREPHSGRVKSLCVGQALGLLVPVGSVHYCLLPPAYQPSHLLGALPG